ncbi:hypothetical protein [Bacillus haynesii]|nr:hypothetical protein [Bacillus haynesii]MEC1559560.1 hypothetical protein [Bacillus haynesii]
MGETTANKAMEYVFKTITFFSSEETEEMIHLEEEIYGQACPG